MITPRLYAHSDIDIAIHHLTPSAQRNDPVVVMCHPTGFCGLTYASVSAHLRNLNIYAIDMRSHGYSERGDVSEWNNFARDIQAAFSTIASHSGHMYFFGVGISSGSSSLILHAQKNPGLYRGLYLCEPILFTPDSDMTHRTSLAEATGRRREYFESRDIAYDRFSHTAFSMLSQSSLALYCTHGFRESNNPEHPGVTLCCQRDDEKEIYLSGAANGVFEALKDIDVYSVIAYGEHSKTVTQHDAELIAHEMKNARVEMIEDTGHFTLLERPYLSAHKISSFIEESISHIITST